MNKEKFLDGIFTYAGVMLLGFGSEVEGNPLVKWLIEEFGAAPGLLIVKCLGICILIWLNKIVDKEKWKRRAFGFIGSIYTVAIVMWIIVFWQHLL